MHHRDKEFYKLEELESIGHLQYYKDALGRMWIEDHEGLMLMDK